MFLCTAAFVANKEYSEGFSPRFVPGPWTALLSRFKMDTNYVGTIQFRSAMACYRWFSHCFCFGFWNWGKRCSKLIRH
ncbi:unnamed protein product [Callosobruchus maculatus]|uniref:Uncharacterized protein n=1 Tax=Callosobruchus maculatus TaxID=64391 RepID=A0A653C7Q5_CALMS|nr:unnamed protein product [Callosobruchus maculatus]